MKIEIRYETFNNEFHADIETSPGKHKYIASENLEELLDWINKIVWNFKANI